LKYFDGNEYDLCGHKNPLNDDALELIYLPYIDACIDVVREIRKLDSSFYPPQRPRNRFMRNYFNHHYNSAAGEISNQFCTIVSGEYICQGLAMYNSIKRHTPEFHLWILCVDELVYNLLEQLDLEKVTLLSLDNIVDEKLSKVKQKRNLDEFCWTLKASLLSYLLNNHWNLESIVYVDADLYFFTDASVIFRDWGEGSVYVTKLGLSSKWAKKVGKYSSGLIGIKRDDVGGECLEYWKRKCIDWCYDKFDEQRWRDQKYIEEWENIAGSALVVSENSGINLGPWNITKGKVSMRNSAYYFNEAQLALYHFSGFEVTGPKSFILCNRKVLPDYCLGIYSDYIRDIKDILKLIQEEKRH